MIIATIIIYCVAAFGWLVLGFAMLVESVDSSKAWKQWRAALPVGILTLWAWWTIIPVVILWGMAKFSKDAWELWRERKSN